MPRSRLEPGIWSRVKKKFSGTEICQLNVKCDPNQQLIVTSLPAAGCSAFPKMQFKLLKTSSKQNCAAAEISSLLHLVNLVVNWGLNALKMKNLFIKQISQQNLFNNIWILKWPLSYSSNFKINQLPNIRKSKTWHKLDRSPGKNVELYVSFSWPSNLLSLSS